MVRMSHPKGRRLEQVDGDLTTKDDLRSRLRVTPEPGGYGSCTDAGPAFAGEIIFSSSRGCPWRHVWNAFQVDPLDGSLWYNITSSIPRMKESTRSHRQSTWTVVQQHLLSSLYSALPWQALPSLSADYHQHPSPPRPGLSSISRVWFSITSTPEQSPRQPSISRMKSYDTRVERRCGQS